MDLLIFVSGTIVGFLIYSLGIQKGIDLEKGKKPQSIIAKIQEKKTAKVLDKEEAEVKTAFENLMNYDGTNQKAGS